jgi:predicted PurR-regulated permease PerM
MATEPAPRSTHGRGESPTPRVRNAWVLMGIAGALFAYLVAPVLLLVLAGIVLAVALDGLAELVAERTPLPRGIALLLIALLMIGLLVVFVMFLAPQVMAQFGEMKDTLEDFAERAIDWLGGLGVTEAINAGADGADIVGVTSTVMEHVARWGMTTLGALASFVIMLTIAGFIAADPGLYRRGLVRLVPHARRPLAEETLSAVARALRWWLLSQLVSMLLLGVTVSLGLWVIGIELWLGLGVLTGLLTFIPYLGPLIAGIPILVIAFAASVETGLIVTAFYLAVQNIESNVVVPWIQHKVVHLAPALAIAAQVLLGLLFGLPGIILAAPLTVVAMVLVQKLWMEAVLGEETQA